MSGFTYYLTQSQHLPLNKFDELWEVTGYGYEQSPGA